MSCAIAFENVTHRYPHAVAVDGVTLRIDEGETVALIGPSGCGKSTLLKLAVGLVWPQQGSVMVAGQELASGNVLEMRRRIGYVIQSGGLFPHLTGEANVTLAARFLRKDDQWIEGRIGELADLVQLPRDALSRFPNDLSGGQRQRVSLMRALMLDPAVLLLDEPLGALDPMVRHGLQEDLRRLFERLGKSVLLVTHDMAEAAFFAKHIVLMRAGKIVQRGTYRDLIESPAEEFVRDFVNAQRSLHAEALNA